MLNLIWRLFVSSEWSVVSKYRLQQLNPTLTTNTTNVKLSFKKEKEEFHI